MAIKIKNNVGTQYFIYDPIDQLVNIPVGINSISFSPSGIYPGQQYISNAIDFKNCPRPMLYEWRSIVRLSNNTNVIIYNIDGLSYSVTSSNPPFIDYAIDQYLILKDEEDIIDTNNRQKCQHYVGPIRTTDVVQDSDGNYTYIAGGLIKIFSRHGYWIWKNNTTKQIAPSGNLVILTPLIDEIQ